MNGGTTQIFDDGSSVTIDATGNLTAVTDQAGNAVAVPPPAGSPVVQQFMDLFNYGARSVLDASLRKTAGPAAAAGAPATGFALTPATKNLLVLGLIGLFVYKFAL